MKGLRKIMAIGMTGLLSMQIAWGDFASEQYQAGWKKAEAERDIAQPRSKQKFKEWKKPDYYTENPPENNYYSTPDKLSGAALDRVANDPTAQTASKAARELIQQGKQVHINPNANWMKRSHLAQTATDAIKIINGSSEYCQEKICKTTWKTFNCEFHPAQIVPCVADLSVIVTPTTEPKQFSGSISPVNANNGTFILPYGTLTAFHLTMRSGNVWRCNTPYSAYLNGQLIQTTSAGCGSELGDLSFNNNAMPEVKSDGITPIQFSLQGPAGGAWSSANWSATMGVPSHAEQDVWSGNCESLGQSCKVLENKCTQNSGTRTIGDIPVTRACWQKSYQFQCGNSSGVDTCKPYLDQGCTQVTPNQFSCPKTTCSEQTQNVCGHYNFCVNDGEDCYKTNPAHNDNFGKAGSQLAAAAQAASQFKGDENPPAIFKGEALSCSDKIIGSITCCSDHGWLSNAIPDLASCNEEAKKLGKAREEGKAADFVKYCVSQDPVTGICFEYKQVFCVFDSLLAFDVQVYGRRDQLHIPFDDGEKSCRGLKVSELQGIDFSKIDFHNFYSAMEGKSTNLPKPDAVQDRIKNNIGKPAWQSKT